MSNMLKKIFSLFFLALAFNYTQAAEEDVWGWLNDETAPITDRDHLFSDVWTDILFPTREFMNALHEEVGFLSKEKMICAHLDLHAMMKVLEKTFDIGKEFIKSCKYKEAEKILIALLRPNQVFNTEHFYICYSSECDDFVCQSFPEFAWCVEERSRPLFTQLWSEFSTANKDNPDLISELEAHIYKVGQLFNSK